MKNLKSPILSIVIPLFNEEAVINSLIARLNSLRKKYPLRTEIIFINDGSTDKTALLLEKSTLHFPAKIISFSRNFGHQSALLAGLKEASGQYIVTMDGDLQHPPELILKMIELYKQGYEVVLTQRFDKQVNGLIKRTTASWFYRLLNLLSQVKIQENASDFRLLSRTALTALLSLPEQRKFLRGMVQWIGFESVILPYKAEKRVRGESKYSLAKMVSLALHGLTSFSTLPLYLSGLFSLVLFLLAFLYALYVLYVHFFGSGIVSGWASVLFMTLIIGGFLSLFIGLIGVYVAAIYDETKARPNFIIKNKKIIGQA
ncbi:MAG: hypothetical protein A2383_01675 [Candidatus Pacebacteria bacterium RIFOXYB1_FULL_39_46]|nr:MAG: hypothetical protein A2182_03190 [Candidatus Pacebacteria bacterium RIFOXYA1_FULL_38_18]OGJ37878.1 MAG: hypothetical protein A2383_01675 [Candidatus Pacebacteria bacterium RIFOXYB1_FULL_39_46]OGJ39477.1 MAG: hypothetical protein A2411_01830 [Candidatus Pacebacteria bacterium RIFOXYC1_FULL_39_21]